MGHYDDVRETQEEKEHFMRMQGRLLHNQNHNHDVIHSPDHYKLLDGVEVKDIVKAVLDRIDSSDMGLSSHQGLWLGQCLQYLLRCYGKGKVEDIRKASKCLEFFFEE